MEYAEGGDLQTLINKAKKAREPLPERDIWKYCIQMINGIKFLHDMKIVHRDLKVSVDSDFRNQVEISFLVLESIATL